MQIRDKLFLVTGAGSGLGEAVARRLATGGARLCLADINPEAVNKLAIELGNNAIGCTTDVTNESNVKGAIDSAIEQFGELVGVIHCAGVGGAKRIVGREGPHDLTSFQRIVDINLTGTFNVNRLAANAMQHNT
jgi:NAD(P)-dependent dehydrogenase (short-subunit alcohol dehydrogenase family)